MAVTGNRKTFLSPEESNLNPSKNDAHVEELGSVTKLESYDKPDQNLSIEPQFTNNFVLIEDQDPKSSEFTAKSIEPEIEPADAASESEFIEVKPKSSFMKRISKISTQSKGENLDEQTKTTAFKSKIGQKDYAGGRLNFKKLKQNIFGGGLKGVWKSLFTVFGLFMVLIVIFGAVGVGYILYLYQNIVFDSNVEQSKTSIVLAADGKTELFKIYGTDGRRQEASWTEVPDQVKFAFLALEDENYYYNDSGISWYNLGGSILNCATTLGKNCRGGSGISQQVVRKLTNDDTRQSGEVVQRKLREIVRAYKLNQDLSKEDILLKYLNVVPLGRNTIGIKEAVQSYFGKDLKDMTVPESCYLAAFPPSPSNYAKSINNSEKDEKGNYTDAWRGIMENRKNICIEKLAQISIQGPGTQPLIPNSEVKTLQDQEVKFQADKNIYKYPHFVEYVRTELLGIFSDDFMKKESLSRADADIKAENLLITGGFKVVTTIDPALQDKVENIIRTQAKKNIIDVGANNAAAVVVDNENGELLSMVGSLAYSKEDLNGIEGIKNPDEFYKELDGKVNVATSFQQPGSSFKPYAYATAFAKGLFNPTTVLMDVKTAFDDNGRPYTPVNYTGGFSGPVTIRSAIANSLNIPAIKSVFLAAGDNQNQSITRVKNTGVANVVNTARDMGVKFDERIKEPEKSCGVQVALGGCEISMVSHATGISTFARMGDKIPVSPFKQICTAQGEDIYNGKMCDGSERSGIRKIKDEYYKKEDKVMDPKIAYEVIDMMTDVEARIPVFGSTRCILTLNNCNRDKEFKDWAVAAKTGTSNENRDTWTVGFTPTRTALVWVGRTDNKPTNDSSMRSAAPIWQNVIKAAVSGQERKDFVRPKDMVEIKVNPSTGLPVGEGEPGTSQWVSEEQKKKLEDSFKAIQDKSAKGELDLLKEDIFSLRSTVFSRTVEINKIDQKLVNDTNRANIAPENIERKSFACPVSEFPWAKLKDVTNWQDPVSSYSRGANQDPNKPSGCGPTELSNTFRTDTTTDDKKPIISFEGFTTGAFYNTYPVRIVLNASTNVPGNVITDTQIFVNGKEKSAGKSNTSSYTIGGGPVEPTVLNIYFKANDNQGNSVTSPVYTITLLPTGTELPNNNGTPNPQPATPAAPVTTTVPALAPAVAENQIRLDGFGNGDTLSGNKDLLVSSPTQIVDPKVVFTSTASKNSSQFTPKELAINGFRYRASFDFSSFSPGEYTVKFSGKDSSGKSISSDEIRVKVVK